MLVLNMRAQQAGYRAIAESSDGGETWSGPWLDRTLPDPACQASVLRLRDGRVLFSNLPGEVRSHLSLRHSLDEGRTWSAPRLLEAAPSAYSSLAQHADGTILCLYERGRDRYHERISVAHVEPGWLDVGEDPGDVTLPAGGNLSGQSEVQ